MNYHIPFCIYIYVYTWGFEENGASPILRYTLVSWDW